MNARDKNNNNDNKKSNEIAIRIKCTCSDWQLTFCRCVSVFRSYERFSFRLNFDLSAARCS